MVISVGGLKGSMMDTGPFVFLLSVKAFTSVQLSTTLVSRLTPHVVSFLTFTYELDRSSCNPYEGIKRVRRINNLSVSNLQSFTVTQGDKSLG